MTVRLPFTGAVFEDGEPASGGVAEPEPDAVDPQKRAGAADRYGQTGASGRGFGASWPSRRGVLNQLTILVVDDHQDVLDLIKTVLRSHGATVVAATSIATALQAAAQYAVDLVLGDIGMLGVDGIELIESVQALRLDVQPRLPRLPAVALTARSLAGGRQQALRAGFQDHVPKPVEPERLVQTIMRLAGRSGGQQP